MPLTATDLLRIHSIITSQKDYRNQVGANEVGFMLFIATNFFCAVYYYFFLVNYIALTSLTFLHTLFLKRLLAIRKDLVTLGSLNSISSIIYLWLITYISSEICDLCA